MEVGEKYGRLTIISKGDPVVSGRQKRGTLRCRCECGVVKDIRVDSIRRGSSKSCGCLFAEAHTSHGHWSGSRASPTYSTWRSMIERVDGKYASLGISCIERWRSFDNFLSDMGERPHGKTLDRINNEGDYGPDNCRWSTPKQQARNRSNNVYVVYKGERRLLIEVCEELGRPYNYAVKRLKVNKQPKWMEKQCVYVC